MKALVTICSRHKDERVMLLPAHARYTGAHIQAAGKIASTELLPLFILSGKFGLIPSDREIPNYDYYLESDAIAELIPIVAGQIREYGITEIEFYTEGKEDWAPYETALRKAAGLTGAKVTERRS